MDPLAAALGGVSLALDDQDRPHIAYVSVPTESLLTAESGWQLRYAYLPSSVPADDVPASATGGPASICPGWNLSYSLTLRNDGDLALENLVITDLVPAGAWFSPGDAGGTLPATYDAASKTIRWQAASLAPGQAAGAECEAAYLHLAALGFKVANAFTISADNLAQPITRVVTTTVDAGLCAATSTPTPTPTATAQPTATPTAQPTATVTPTATPSGVTILLPLIFRGR